MPITQSAKKAMRQARRRALANRAKKDALKRAVKKYRKFVAAKKMEEAKTALPVLYKIIDKTAKANVIKKNKARRMKSRLSRMVAAK